MYICLISNDTQKSNFIFSEIFSVNTTLAVWQLGDKSIWLATSNYTYLASNQELDISGWQLRAKHNQLATKNYIYLVSNQELDKSAWQQGDSIWLSTKRQCIWLATIQQIKVVGNNEIDISGWQLRDRYIWKESTILGISSRLFTHLANSQVSQVIIQISLAGSLLVLVAACVAAEALLAAEVAAPRACAQKYLHGLKKRKTSLELV